MEPGMKLLCPDCHVVNGVDNDVAQECANCHTVLTPRDHLYEGDAHIGTRLTEA